jgi:lipoyl(octanoyl) transferase
MQGIEVCDTDRGGRVTYHGPGQLVGYPIVGLRPYGDDVHGYLRRMERLIVAALAEWEVEAEVVAGLTGVWTREQRKVASIGVHVSRGVTTHGFAINVNNDLQPFEWIVPCGIESCRMTSLARELSAALDVDEFATTVRDRFGELYERAPAEIGIDELAGRVPGIEALAGATAALR